MKIFCRKEDGEKVWYTIIETNRPLIILDPDSYRDGGLHVIVSGPKTHNEPRYVDNFESWKDVIRFLSIMRVQLISVSE